MTLGESISELVVVLWRLFWKPKNKYMRQIYNPCWEKKIKILWESQHLSINLREEYSTWINGLSKMSPHFRS